MTGHIRKRGERSWELKYDVGISANGQRKTRYASFKGTKREAALELAKLITAAAAGEQVDPSRVTVAEFLERWERDWCASNVSPKTAERYGELMRLHVTAHLGAVKMQKLRAVQLVDLYGKLAGVLAPRTIGHVHRVLHQALARAVEWDLITSNVTERVTPSRVEQEEVDILQVGELRAVMEAVRGRWINPIARLALATGMRRGEILALRWQDVDLERGRVTVARSLEQTKAGLRFKEPKTRHGRRTITLPASAVTDLRSHWRDRQEIQLRLGAGKSPPDSLVFCDLDGGPSPSPDRIANVDEGSRRRQSRCHFPQLATHTHASHLIAAGVDILTISRRIGHASPTITLDVYGHLMPQTDDKAALAIEAALSASTEIEQMDPLCGGNPVAIDGSGGSETR